MKTYKVLRAWEGVEIVGTELNEDELLVYLSGFEIAIALHLGFIEEVGAVKKERFVPKDGERYWYLDEDCAQCVDTYLAEDHMYHYEKLNIHNCYRTEAEALEARERVLKAY